VWDKLVQRLSEKTATNAAMDDDTNVIEFVRGILSDLTCQLNEITHLSSSSKADVVSQLSSAWIEQVDTSVLTLVHSVQDYWIHFQEYLVQQYPIVQPYWTQFQQFITTTTPPSWISQTMASSPTASVVLSASVTYGIVSSILNWDRAPPPRQPYPAQIYDPIAARAYFDNQWHVVLGRALEIVFQSSQFGFQLLQDQWFHRTTDTEYQRGQQLATLLTKLGPTFIKVGQSLSIRTDLLSPAYIRGLETLQDQVPPFDTNIAKQILQQEWNNQPMEKILEQLPTTPIAAASLGQVYRAKLKSTGQEVAIKVQRPHIMEQIALDMHLLREVAPWVKRWGNLNSDTVGTVDAWGTGFVDELNYLAEANNAAYFTQTIAQTPLSSVVLAPRVIPEYSTRTVLVTEWVDGQRLDKSSATDVTVLCSIAMNT
jgi:hypothetical protein